MCVEGKTNGDGSVKVGDDYFMQVGSDITATGNMTEYEYDFRDYQGERGRFAIRHYKTSDQFELNIDDVKLDIDHELLPPPTTPLDLAVMPESKTADVSWTDDDDSSWNIRYRVFNPNEKKSYLWDFDTEESIEGWRCIDWDKDNNNWAQTQALYFAHSGNYVMGSLSFLNNTELDPDNWLISPQVPLVGTLSLWAYSNFDDNFGVYVLNGTYDEENFDPDEWVKVGDDHKASDWAQYTFDLSSFAGESGHFAIRHYNSYDEMILNVDDITLDIPGDEPNEWSIVEGITSTSYMLTDLSPSTTYEIQVQAYNANEASKWSESVVFTTTDGLTKLYDNTDNSETISANNEKTTNAKLCGRKLYKDGSWNTLCLPFEFNLEGSLLEDATIKVLNEEETSFDYATGTLTLHFNDYNESTYIAGTPCIVRWDSDTPSEVEDPVFDGVVIKDLEPTATTSGDNSVSFEGIYSPYTVADDDNTTIFIGANNKLYTSEPNSTFGAFRCYFRLNNGLVAGSTSEAQQTSVRSFVLNFGEGETTGIVNVEANSSLSDALPYRSEWYTLDGRRLNIKPAQRGIYIVNGKKVVIK